MRIRTGHNPEDWRDEGQAAARVMGHGGRMLGEYTTSTMAQRKPPEDRQRIPRAPLVRCGFVMRYGLTCARLAGHPRRSDGPGHRSLEGEWATQRRRGAA